MPYTIMIGTSRRISVYARTPERALDIAIHQQYGSRTVVAGQAYTIIKPNGTSVSGTVEGTP